MRWLSCRQASMAPFEPAWLVVSGAAYVLGMAPMGWFWHRTLEAFGYQPPLMATMRAYYFGQLGKYVPGKAMVIILRVAAMRRWAPSMRLVIVSVFLETLTVMAVGALLAFLISALVLKSEAYISLIALGMAAAAGGADVAAGVAVVWSAWRGAVCAAAMTLNRKRRNRARFNRDFAGLRSACSARDGSLR